MTRTATIQTTYVAPPGLDFEIALSHVTEQSESEMLFCVRPREILIGYLTHDADCQDPTEGDGEGKIYTSRRNAGKDEHFAFQQALGLDSDWNPNFALLNEADVVASAHAAIFQDQELFTHALQHCTRMIEQGFCKRLIKEDNETFVKRVLYDINELTPVVDLDAIQKKLWDQGRINGTIGNKYAVKLDVFEHGQISYSVSGEGPQCQFDTSKGGAIWVPDHYAVENFEDKSLSLEENQKKAREYARSCVKNYSDWCNGDTHAIVIEMYDRDSERKRTEQLELVCGFIGYDEAMKELKDTFDGFVTERAPLQVIEAPELAIDKVLYKETNGVPHERGRGERRVVANLIAYLEAKGFKLAAVYDGEDMEDCTTMKVAMELIFNLDDSHVYFQKEGFQRHWVRFVLGNSPEEVIADNSYSEGDEDGFGAAMDAFNAEDYV